MLMEQRLLRLPIKEISFMVVGLQLMKIGWVNLSVQKQETRFRGYWVITMRY